jgi:hypothetical protein
MNFVVAVWAAAVVAVVFFAVVAVTPPAEAVVDTVAAFVPVVTVVSFAAAAVDAVSPTVDVVLAADEVAGFDPPPQAARTAPHTAILMTNAPARERRAAA